MVRNVRWLYSKLGTEDFSATGQSTVTGALSSLKSDLDGKSNSSHTHSTGTLPVSSNQVNSGSYIPTSALLYSMAQRVEGIQSIVNLAKRELDDPNKRYESKNLGTWSSVSDVDTFLSSYTHENNYGDLALGNYFTIQDGTYNKEWEIAGFDMEHGQLAADGTTYDNGYGICLIPKTYISVDKWGSRTSVSGNSILLGAYNSSSMNKSVLPNIATKLENVLESHLVTRNVLLSSSVINNNHTSNHGRSNGYTWTTAKATLMSIGQMNGTFANYYTKYDDGEANYKLPLFDYETYRISVQVWTRCISGMYGYYVWTVTDSSTTTTTTTSIPPDYSKTYTRPMIYIR